MDKKLLDILVCPVSRQPLRFLDAARLEVLNAALAAGTVRFAGQEAGAAPLQQALITADNKRVYRVDDDIPVLLPEEGIETAALPGLRT